jgi:hypothetical protein
MKYHVAKAATLSFPDGTKSELTPGVHDSKSFSDAEKNHWAFGAYVKPLDEADLLKEQEASNNAARVALLETENTDLKAQLESRDEAVGNLTNEVLALKALLGEKDSAIETLNSELVALKDPKNGKKQ